jgi:hypothetical protein
MEPPSDLKAILDDAAIIEYRHYKIKYGNTYEVICPTYGLPDGTPLTLIPYWLVPGRPYPIFVYLHANGLYSSNAEKGQRWAADETREKFGLETFSHSTVSRSLKSIEGMQKRSLGRLYGDELNACGPQAPPCDVSDDLMLKPAGLPTSGSTAWRRKAVAGFLQWIINAINQNENIETASKKFALLWHEHNQCLMLGNKSLTATVCRLKIILHIRKREGGPGRARAGKNRAEK